MDIINDTIELTLPFNAKYVSIARLTASGVAAGIGFDIDVVEDIKVCVAEVCNKLVGFTDSEASGYRVIFKPFEGGLQIIFDCEDKSFKCIFNNAKDELGLYIINALMDSVEFCDGKDYLLVMSKKLEGNN